MIKFCIGVLKGTEPENNPRKITKPVAVILLAHYIGDIHQPLHIGAEFFDNTGKPMNPDTQTGQANSDQGGNFLTLHLRDAAGGLETEGSMHSYWDDKAVRAAFDILFEEILTSGGGSGGVTENKVAQFLANTTPAGWAEPSSGIESWSEDWANELLPMAREAHQRLEFDDMVINTHKHTAAGQALEKAVSAGSESYADFAAKSTRNNIHKAGWRLELVLRKALE